MAKFGPREFGFLPQTYVLPHDLRLLKQNWDFKNGGGNEMWIIKPVSDDLRSVRFESILRKFFAASFRERGRN